MHLSLDFVNRTKLLLGESWDNFSSALLDEEPSVSIRINSKKIEETRKENTVPWCSNGYYLAERPSFTFDPIFHLGGYYVQEASSMFVEYAVKQVLTDEIRCLDLCAAPGGKSTLMSSLLSENSLLVSNEIIRSRAFILEENLMKWGNPNVVVTNNNPDDFQGLRHYFDLMLIDAPCSGEGMFRKDKQAIYEWSISNVIQCAQRQKEIITSVWDTLRPGGHLIYSTCTYNREENEDIVAWVCDTYKASVIDLNVPESWGISESNVIGKPTYHFYPHKIQGEGFFLAVLQKNENEEKCSMKHNTKKQKERKSNSSLLTQYQNYIKDVDRFAFDESENILSAFPVNLADDLFLLKRHLNIIHSGVVLGEAKGKDFIPCQSLALSNFLDQSKFNTLDISWNMAISFLRKEPLTLSSVPKGIILLTYRDKPLGFVKNLGNRANNLYPNEWRIRSANIPEQTVDVLADFSI